MLVLNCSCDLNTINLFGNLFLELVRKVPFFGGGGRNGLPLQWEAVLGPWRKGENVDGKSDESNESDQIDQSNQNYQSDPNEQRDQIGLNRNLQHFDHDSMKNTHRNKNTVL